MKLFWNCLLIFLIFSACQRKSTVRIETPYGTIRFAFHKECKRHQQRFLVLAKAGYWDSLSFNRVVPNFVIQGGCRDTDAGFAGSVHLEEAEIFPHLKHVYGAVGAGRDDNPEKRSAVCQFYIVQNPQGLPRLDGKYIVIGRVTEGMAIVDSIARMPRDSKDQPLVRIPIRVREE